jgi:hypothetical protein
MSRAVELGATTMAIPAEDMPGVGRFVNLLDPDGNMFGLISPSDVRRHDRDGTRRDRVTQSLERHGSRPAQRRNQDGTW